MPPIIIDSQEHTKAYIEDHYRKEKTIIENDGSIVRFKLKNPLLKGDF